jgi:hypothetical protein
MSVVAGTRAEHLALLEEYRVALHDWLAARVDDPLNSRGPTVLKATKRIEELEYELKTHQTEHGCLIADADQRVL